MSAITRGSPRALIALMVVTIGAVPSRVMPTVTMHTNLVAIRSAANSPSCHIVIGPNLASAFSPERKGRVRTNASTTKEGKRNRFNMKRAGNLEIIYIVTVTNTIASDKRMLWIKEKVKAMIIRPTSLCLASQR